MNALTMPKRSTVAGGVLLIGLGLLVLTNWWWPGIMLVVGTASATEQLVRGKLLAALGAFVFFVSIPLVITLVDVVRIPWVWVGACVLMGLGVVTIVRSALGRVG